MKTYLRHKIVNVIDVKGLVALEYLDFEGRYKEYVEQHDFWELCYVEEGKISFRSDTAERILRQGEIILIEPNQSHAYYSDKGNKNRAFVVCFESSSQALKSLSGVTFSAAEGLVDCLNRIIQENKHTFYMDEKGLLTTAHTPNFGGQQAILIHLEYLLICLIRQLSLEEEEGVVFLKNDKFYAEISQVIIRFFQENIYKKLTLDDICENVNYSRSFLCRTFKEQTGETLFSCFNRLKIEEAKKLLQKTALSAVSISQKLGFSDVKYFSALFKRLVGVSPIAYRTKK